MQRDALELAMRVLTCVSQGIYNRSDYRKPPGFSVKIGAGNLCGSAVGKECTRTGHRGLTTALAVNAIRLMGLPILYSVISPRKWFAKCLVSVRPLSLSIGSSTPSRVFRVQ